MVGTPRCGVRSYRRPLGSVWPAKQRGRRSAASLPRWVPRSASGQQRHEQATKRNRPQNRPEKSKDRERPGALRQAAADNNPILDEHLPTGVSTQSASDSPNPANARPPRATLHSVASLLLWIVRRHAVSAQASDAMMSLLERPLSPPRPTENQVKEFLGESLPPGSKLWSKEGDTSEVRHDAAYVELPDGRKLVVVILTRGAADDKTLLPGIGKRLLGEVGSRK